MNWAPVIISAKTACLSILVTFFIGILLAHWVVRMRSEKARMLIDGILTLPMVLPPTVMGFFLLFIFGVKRPVGKFILEFFGWKIVFTWWATVIAAVVISLPLMYRSARGAFEQVDQNLIYAGRTLGKERMVDLLAGNYACGIAGCSLRRYSGICQRPGRIRRDSDAGGQYRPVRHRRCLWRFIQKLRQAIWKEPMGMSISW